MTFQQFCYIIKSEQYNAEEGRYDSKYVRLALEASGGYEDNPSERHPWHADSADTVKSPRRDSGKGIRSEQILLL